MDTEKAIYLASCPFVFGDVPRFLDIASKYPNEQEKKRSNDSIEKLKSRHWWKNKEIKTKTQCVSMFLLNRLNFSFTDSLLTRCTHCNRV